MEERSIGKVTHYYSHLNVATLELTEPLRVGDEIHIKGHTSDFRQRVESMQVEHETVTEAAPGAKVAIQVVDHAREHDLIFRVAP